MPWGLFLVKCKSAVGLGWLISPIEWCNRDFSLKNVVKELSALASPLGDESRSLGFFCKSFTLSRGVFPSSTFKNVCCVSDPKFGKISGPLPDVLDRTAHACFAQRAMDRFLTDSIHEESGNPTCMEACPIDPTDEMQVEAEVQSSDSTTHQWDNIFSAFSLPSYPNNSLPISSSSAYSLPVPPVSPNSDSSDYQPTSPLFLSPTLRRSTRSQPGAITHPLGTEEATSVAPPSGFASL